MIHRLTEPFRPAVVTASFTEFDLRNNPREINRGHCMQWAYMAYLMFEKVELWSMGAHAFVKYQDKFYDSERLQGETNWKDLPACNFGHGCGCPCCRRGAKSQHEKAFRKFWVDNFIKPNWERYEQLAKEGIENYVSGLLRINQ